MASPAAAPTLLPLGTTAHKQGRIASEDAALDLSSAGDPREGDVKHRRQFAGTLGTQVVKDCDLAVARTGLLEPQAKAAGFEANSAEAVVWNHKQYYPGAHKLHFRVTGDGRDGRLLSAQIVGHWQAEVAKRVDVFAAALFQGLLVDELNDLDMSYTPPVSSPWDRVQMAAQAWLQAHHRHHS